MLLLGPVRDAAQRGYAGRVVKLREQFEEAAIDKRFGRLAEMHDGFAVDVRKAKIAIPCGEAALNILGQHRKSHRFLARPSRNLHILRERIICIDRQHRDTRAAMMRHDERPVARPVLPKSEIAADVRRCNRLRSHAFHPTSSSNRGHLPRHPNAAL